MKEYEKLEIEILHLEEDFVRTSSEEPDGDPITDSIEGYDDLVNDSQFRD